MARWMVLMLVVACGRVDFDLYEPALPTSDDSGAPPDEPAPPTSDDSGPPPGEICASVATSRFRVAACATPSADAIHISNTVTLDTDTGTSNPPGLTCTSVSYGYQDWHLCIVAAPDIVLEPGGVLSAHGRSPLALFAHTITVQGTLDVASHIRGGAVGAGSSLVGCTAGNLPKGNGGGRGGFGLGQAGKGGDSGGMPQTGATGGASFAGDTLYGGCGGTRGGDGSTDDVSDGGETSGGPGGGAVWIAADTTLALTSTAIVNASGAGGKGGSTGGSGGGAGGMIVLHSPTITTDLAAMIFANGGHGGGGAGSGPNGFTIGLDGTDPTSPDNGGGSGIGANGSGDGAAGYPASPRDGQPGATTGHGGGGGGGAAGAIYVLSASTVSVDGTNISPPVVYLGP